MACQKIYCLIAYGVFAKIPEKDMKRYKNPFSCPAVAFNVWFTPEACIQGSNNASQFFITPHVHIGYWHLHVDPQGPNKNPSITSYLLQLDHACLQHHATQSSAMV